MRYFLIHLPNLNTLSCEPFLRHLNENNFPKLELNKVSKNPESYLRHLFLLQDVNPAELVFVLCEKVGSNTYTYVYT